MALTAARAGLPCPVAAGVLDPGRHTTLMIRDRDQSEKKGCELAPFMIQKKNNTNHVEIRNHGHYTTTDIIFLGNC